MNDTADTNLISHASDLGVVLGKATVYEFSFLITGAVEKNAFVSVHHERYGEVLARVDKLVNNSTFNAEEALAYAEGISSAVREVEVAHAQVIGCLKEGRRELPGMPVPAGSIVTMADKELISVILGLNNHNGALIGRLHGTDIDVFLDIDTMVQKHISILAKTGSGKSYLAGVIVEEMIKHGVTVLIIDPHGEYHTLKEPADTNSSTVFAERVRLLATAPELNPGTERLAFTFSNFRPEEILSLTSLAGDRNAEALLFNWMNSMEKAGKICGPEDISDMEGDTPLALQLKEEITKLSENSIFSSKGSRITEIVSASSTSVVSLMGTSPEAQSLCVKRLLEALFEARKRDKIPPLLVVLEEAHNFCPQQGKSAASQIIRTLAAEGRKFGIGLMVISQRPARVDKNVISQCNTQFVLRVTNVNDLKAVGSSMDGLTDGLLDEIPRLEPGTTIAAGSSLQQPLLIDVRKRETRHGGESISLVNNG
ncbi:MAG: ATP-binding protein [Methanomassiliicoccales archaeon]